MFATLEHHKHPLSSIYGGTAQLWRAVEIELRRPWFLVEVDTTDTQENGVGVARRTMCISNIDDVIGLLPAHTDTTCTLRSVSMLEPSREACGGWAMHPISEVWEGIEPVDRTMKTKIVLKTSGEQCALSLFGTPADAIQGRSKVVDFPLAGK
ncbi:hypothetical protein N5J07_09310 [Comamonas aquatica]|uniref:hypothetical protein n=1 Tax=Comamonas aquatica TaxID=225991 RepID=UPI00244D35DD|nr:hypothetical protein [Comamonas aquatica]MDH1379645.1 hypothetical protein [Comamonas aquatica]MDH1639614.1 hypothetical protein [Comamonas aquatica]